MRGHPRYGKARGEEIVLHMRAIGLFAQTERLSSTAASDRQVCLLEEHNLNARNLSRHSFY
jgi:hypothetical protein